MAISIGDRVGAYEVTARLGAGGMGEVYQARDHKLDRDVAIKVLPPALAADPDRTARFDREAKVLASLNHPNIAAIYGLEHAGDTACLVLELVPGETLADRIERGPVPIDEALRLARQIAEALEAAHEKGIVHRDLKPANIKVTDADKVKVLDFGLAKALSSDGDERGSSIALSSSPTITTPAHTRLGVVLGTAAYMAPEQARGKTVDKRADIWAFGCVLYEMVTGRRPFISNEVSDTLALVLTKEPDWTALPSSTPPSLRRLLRRCMEKDRAHRLADIADARLDIDEILTAPAGEVVPVVAGPRPGPIARAVPWAVAALALMAAAVMFARSASRQETPAQIVRVTTDLEIDTTTGRATAQAIALTPDGSALIYVATAEGGNAPTLLYVRTLGELQAVRLEGTDGAAFPFVSPSGEWVAFFAGGKLKKVSLKGGVVVSLCDVPAFRGAAWLDEETIVFQQAGVVWGVGPLMRVSAAGGRPEMLFPGEDELPARWPQVLPEGRGLLVTVPVSTVQRTFDDATIAVQSLDGGSRKVVHAGYFARYVPSGHLIYVRDRTLFAAAFDLDRLEVVGTPVPVATGVRADPATGFGAFSVSDTGSLVYLKGNANTATTERPMHWVHRGGTSEVLRPQPAEWGAPNISPDGQRIAMMMRGDGQTTDIYVYEWARDALTRLSNDQTDDIAPVWSHDGRWIAYGSRESIGPAGVVNLYARRSDGTGSPIRLTESTVTQLPDAWHSNGKFIAFHEGSPNTGNQNLMILPLEGDSASGWKPGEPTMFVGGPGIKGLARFSPDGRWLAYGTAGQGIAEILVRPFPGPGGQWQISGAGGEPKWSRARPEIVFRQNTLPNTIVRVPYRVDGDTFIPERSEPWSPIPIDATPVATIGLVFDLHPDGERIVAALPVEATEAEPDRAVLVFNFFEELKRLGID